MTPFEKAAQETYFTTVGPELRHAALNHEPERFITALVQSIRALPTSTSLEVARLMIEEAIGMIGEGNQTLLNSHASDELGKDAIKDMNSVALSLIDVRDTASIKDMLEMLMKMKKAYDDRADARSAVHMPFQDGEK